MHRVLQMQRIMRNLKRITLKTTFGENKQQQLKRRR